MIFVVLGSQKFPFDRLLKAVDEQIAKGSILDSVFAQTGYSNYKPINYEYKQFLSRDEFAQMTDKSDIVIAHGGTGAIMGALKKGKKVIAVPRNAAYGEHVDDHQQQLVRQFRELDLIYECDDCEKISEALEYVKQKEFTVYRSNTQMIIDNIERFINNYN